VSVDLWYPACHVQEFSTPTILVPAIARYQDTTKAEAFPTNTTNRPTTKTLMLRAFPTARLLNFPFAMDDITHQMNTMALLGNANVDDFNAGLIMYFSYVATNTDAGTEIKLSKAPKDLRAWIKEHKGGN
jgi:hypothetical protein